MSQLDPTEVPLEDDEALIDLLEDDEFPEEPEDEIGGRWFKSHGWTRGTSVW